MIEGLLYYLLNEVIQNDLYTGTSIGLVMAIVFTTSVYLVALKPHQLGWDEVGVRSFSKQYWIRMLGWTILLIVASISIVAIMDVLQIGIDNHKTKSLKQDMNGFTFSIGFISAAIISPVYEEIFYRGFLYKWFRAKWGVGIGLVASSIIFTLVHIPTYNTLPINFLSGLIFAWTYEKTGSIVPAILIHGTVNGLGVILTAMA
ncbi:CPBP family intramembrane metalloprotease [Radiobacillus deserti]|uniref:CPBP family intramembrane metalloprotease n=2 Tax=Radiobacillus deserti TaxID=2594883 RepID=A0A516KKZ6_9BACI|nr:CPBP family intramembrane metalloprotease [Radiobacillus deserti]